MRSKDRRYQALPISILLCVALTLTLGPFSTNGLISRAEAATLHRGDVARASSGGIVLDTDLYTKRPSFDKTVSTTTTPSSSSSDTIYTYFYGLQVPAKSYTSLGTTVSVRWNNVGFDADDDRIDLVVSWLPDSRWYSEGKLTRVPLLQRYDHNGFGTAGICIGLDYYTTGAKTCCEEHLKLNFYKHGTTTLATGSFLTRFTDLDQEGWDGAYGDRWCESVEFISGHSNDMYIPSGNILNIGKNRNNEEATDYRATKEMDGSSVDSGVVVRLAPGAEFWYYSAHGWTDILDQFDAKAIRLSSGSGGSVSCGDRTDTVAVGWRGSRTIAIRPSTGYKVADVKVDGSSVGARNAYTFTNVTTDHAISATFSPINYQVRFNGNGAGGSMAAMSVPYDATRTLTANAFARAGYRFTGWNTKADGSGSAFQDQQSIRNLSNSDGAMIELYAQWEPCSYEVTFNSNGGEGSMQNQRFTYDKAQALALNQFARSGYLFTGWNTIAGGSGTSYSNTQEVKNLVVEDRGHITLFAQWQPINYFIAFDGQGADGSMYDQQLTFDEAQALSKNLFRWTGHRWAKWDTNPSVPETAYADCAVVKNLTDRANEVVTLFAVWMANRCLVVYDANGGTGEMQAQSLAYGTPETLYPIAFEREGYEWTSWNTAPDGSGDTFANEQEVQDLREEDNSVLILYAQWKPLDSEQDGNEITTVPDVPETGSDQPVDKDEESYDLGENLDDQGSATEAPPNEDETATSGTHSTSIVEASAAPSIPTPDDAYENEGIKQNETGSTLEASKGAFAKTGAALLPLFYGAAGLLAVGAIFILYGMRKRARTRAAKRELLRARLNL